MKNTSEMHYMKDYKVRLLVKLLMIFQKDYFVLPNKKELERKLKKLKKKEGIDKFNRQVVEMPNR